MLKLFFRADGNQNIATGHLMRCLTIARACQKYADENGLQADIHFVVSDQESVSLLKERMQCSPSEEPEFPVVCLSCDYRTPALELPALIRLLTDAAKDFGGKNDAPGQSPVVLFIDSYFVSPDYFQALTPYCRLAYLDDLRSFDCPVDLVINYDTALECTHYQSAGAKLLGAAYTPLREQFCRPSYAVRDHVTDILLSTGGTDPLGITLPLIRRIRTSSLEKCTLHILTSHANIHYEELARLAGTDSDVRLHENVSDVASLMSSCDLAVSAGGTTLCELCAVGVPSVSFIMADNQRTAAQLFSDEGLIPCAGDIRSETADVCASASSQPDPRVLDTILAFLMQASEDLSLRKNRSHSMRAFLDGCGADRIARALFRLS